MWETGPEVPERGLLCCFRRGTLGSEVLRMRPDRRAREGVVAGAPGAPQGTKATPSSAPFHGKGLV